MIRRAPGAAALAVSLLAGAAVAEPLSFAALAGWEADDHAAALATFLRSCDRARPVPPVRRADWAGVCARGRALGPDPGPEAARAFFEAEFVPVAAGGERTGLITGYFEPLLDGARERSGTFPVPLYAPPPDLPRSRPWLTRAEIEAGALAGRGLEIAWLRDPVDAFFLQVQGSGRIRLPDGGTLRLGFAARNNRPYRSLGAHLVAEGHLPREGLSAEVIAAWLRADPGERLRHLLVNPSFVFFRVLDLDADLGPLGAMEVPLTPGRSLAVDREEVPLGAPVWLETETDAGPLARLMVAQDTGTAIRGPGRGDVFFGWGEEAWRLASRQDAPGRMAMLLPRAAVERAGR